MSHSADTLWWTTCNTSRLSTTETIKQSSTKLQWIIEPVLRNYRFILDENCNDKTSGKWMNMADQPIPSYLTSTSPVPWAGVRERGVIKRTVDTAVLSQPFNWHNRHSGLTRWTRESCSTLSQMQGREPDYLIFCCSRLNEREEKEFTMHIIHMSRHNHSELTAAPKTMTHMLYVF